MLNETFTSDGAVLSRYIDDGVRYLVGREEVFYSVYGLPSQLPNSNYYVPVTAENSEYIETIIYSYFPEGSIIGPYETKRFGFEIVYGLEYMEKNYEFNYVKYDIENLP